MKTATILSTRVINAQNTKILHNSSVNWIEKDFIQTESIAFEMQEEFEFLLFTSQNAIKSVLQSKGDSFFVAKNVFCVGSQTKSILEQYGSKVIAWAHYAKDLAQLIKNDFPGCTISFFSGNIRSDVLPNAFRALGILYKEVSVYQTSLNPIKIEHSLDGICFYSPSAVASFVQQNAIGDANCFCIGTTTSKAVEQHTDRIFLADFPTIESTIKVCLKYYQ